MVLEVAGSIPVIHPRFKAAQSPVSMGVALFLFLADGESVHSRCTNRLRQHDLADAFDGIGQPVLTRSPVDIHRQVRHRMPRQFLRLLDRRTTLDHQINMRDSTGPIPVSKTDSTPNWHSVLFSVVLPNQT